jgi:hypothetical protein
MVDMIEMEKLMQDYCSVCKRFVPEGTEHSPKAHGSTKELADELAAWKSALKKTGEHH